MNKILLTLTAMLLSFFSYAQCPELIEAMVNACGTTEGANEFVVFTTSTAANAGTYTLNYGSTNPPTVNNLAGTDASTKTGTGSVSTSGGGCAVIEVTSPSTLIPAGSRVIFVPSVLDQNYDVSGICDGSNPLYVVYIKINSAGGSNSNWSTNGTMANAATNFRYLQVTYSGSGSCNGANAPVKDYLASGHWAELSGTPADGNYVRWMDTAATYGNNGCTSVILPVGLLDLRVAFIANSNVVNWQTSQEINTAHFIVERSFDGKNFTALNSVAAAGNSNSVKSYQITDNKIEYRLTYYRIKTIDADGRFTVSKIVKINPSKNNIGISNVYPNPAREQLFVEWNAIAKSNSQLQVLDISGRLIKHLNMSSNSGFNKQAIDVAALPKGKYIIKIISDKEVVVDSFMK